MNVIASPAATRVTLDGTSVRTWPKATLPDGTIIYRNAAGTILPGAHVLASDAPVGASLYGYSIHSGETIAYPATSGLLAPPGADTTAPRLAWNEDSACAEVRISDSESGLSHLAIDSLVNCTLSPDSTFVPGDSIRSTFLELCVTDTNEPALLRIIAYDMAGNRTVGELDYTAPVKTLLKPGFSAQTIAFDTCLVGTSKTLAAVTITDTSSYWPLSVDSIWIDNPVFRDTIASDKFPFTLAPLAAHTLQIVFAPTNDYSYTSYLHIQTASAGTQTVVLRGSGYSMSAVALPGTSELAEWLATGSGEAMLLPPAPNPASGSLALDYALRAPAPVSFDLFTALGIRVYHRGLGTQSSGEHSELFDLPELSQGSYFFRLSAGGETHSAKIEIR